MNNVVNLKRKNSDSDEEDRPVKKAPKTLSEKQKKIKDLQDQLAQLQASDEDMAA